MPNFSLLDLSRPEIADLLAAMLQARAAVERRSWWHPQEPTGEEWWADVLADPRARRQSRSRLARPTDQTSVLPAAGRAARDHPGRLQQVRLEVQPSTVTALIASHGPDHLLTDLLGELASPTCSQGGASLGSLRRVLRRADQRN